MSKIFVAQGYKVFYNLLSKKQFLTAVGTRELCQVREIFFTWIVVVVSQLYPLVKTHSFVLINC